MLLSMTGFGRASREGEDLAVEVEIRTVNNRYLKVHTKFPDGYGAIEGAIERLARDAIGRGTVTISVRTTPVNRNDRGQLDLDAASGYWRELNRIAEALHTAPPGDVTPLLSLPGVVRQVDSRSVDVEAVAPLIEEATTEALQRLDEFRRTEGESMRADLRTNADGVTRELDAVAVLTPQVVAQHRERILERVGDYLATHDVQVQPADVVREVAIYADKADVNEEITRLRSHLEQFASFLDADTSQGRKLDFLVQEMFREVNTIGSKSNNVTIAHHVVEMKACIERIREVLANVE